MIKNTDSQDVILEKLDNIKSVIKDLNSKIKDSDDTEELLYFFKEKYRVLNNYQNLINALKDF